MSGSLLDTNVPSELLRTPPDARAAAWLRSQDRTTFFVSVVTLGEIRKGIALLPHGQRRENLTDWFARLLDPWFGDRVLPVTRSIAERWGELYALRQRTGRPLHMADGLIAATALEHGLRVVTRNVGDFSGLGADIVNPWAT